MTDDAVGLTRAERASRARLAEQEAKARLDREERDRRLASDLALIEARKAAQLAGGKGDATEVVAPALTPTAPVDGRTPEGRLEAFALANEAAVELLKRGGLDASQVAALHGATARAAGVVKQEAVQVQRVVRFRGFIARKPSPSRDPAPEDDARE